MVIIASQEDVLPPISTALNVTVLGPKLSQLNKVCEEEKVTPQLSNDPLLIRAGETFIVPSAPNSAVVF